MMVTQQRKFLKKKKVRNFKKLQNINSEIVKDG